MQRYRYFSGESRHDRIPRSMREAYQADYRLHVQDEPSARWDAAKAGLIIAIGAPIVYWLAGVI